MKLSGRGLPRPLAEHDGILRPVPWSQGDTWGVAKESRGAIAQRDGRCLVCGEEVKDGVVFVRADKSDMVNAEPIVVTSSPVKDEYDINDLPPAENPRVVEGALHEGCAKLTRAHCKPARERIHEEIWVVRPYRRGRYKRGHRPVIEYR